jgi:hypothetical protein
VDNYYLFPFAGQHPVASPFGPRTIAGIPGFHAGVDFAWNVEEGSHFVVCATADGKVIYFADEGLGGGRTMTLVHAGGEQSRYYHLDHPLVDVGTEVLAMQPIAISGETGGVAPHLHFEIHNKSGLAVDPLPLLQTWPTDARPDPVAPPAPPIPASEEDPLNFYVLRCDDGRLGIVWENTSDVFLPGAYGEDQIPKNALVVKANVDSFNFVTGAPK